MRANGGKVCLFLPSVFYIAEFTASIYFLHSYQCLFLEKEAQDFASQVFPPGFLVIHDATGGSHDDVTVNRKGKISNLKSKS